MIPWISAAFLVTAFVILAHRLKLVEKSKHAADTAHKSLKIVANPDLSDEEKETELQRNAITLFRLFLVLAIGGATAVLLPIGVLWLCSLVNILSLEAALRAAISPAFLIVSGLLALAFLTWNANRSDEQNRYSSLDRLLHRVAFRTSIAQVSLADFEDRMFAKQLAGCNPKRPVFITALPRAGTTLLLTCIARLPDFASHTYRDMPFVLTPCLWNRFSARFKQTTELRERSHGDGMMIGPDSPEALEEVLWKTFWRKHYRRDRIVPWKTERQAEFHEFFEHHMRKIILLRKGDDASQTRYVSKNNLNIARIAWLRQRFPDSTTIVPFRDPLQHAASLLRQHQNFLKIHKQDRFASEYMRAIGHFDFGANLRPVDFDNWIDQRTTESPEEIGFWLEYWVACYRHLLSADTASCHFIHYDELCTNPERGLRKLAELTGTHHPELLVSSATEIHPLNAREVSVGTASESLLREADTCYQELRSIAVNG